MPRKSTPQINIPLTEDQREIIRQIAQQSNAGSMSNWVRQAIREKLKREGVEFPPDAQHGGDRKAAPAPGECEQEE